MPRAISCFLYTCLGEANQGVAYGLSAMERNPYAPDWYAWMLACAYRILAMAQGQLGEIEAARAVEARVVRPKSRADLVG